MSLGPMDPGPCPICGTAHCACGAETDVVQLPNRDTAAALERAAPPAAGDVAPALGDGSDGKPFSTATYRKKPRGPSSRT